MTKPRVVLLCNSVGFEMLDLYMVPFKTVVTSCFTPATESKATPASTNGRTTLTIGKPYFPIADTTASDFEFPLLGKYRFPMVKVVHPFEVRILLVVQVPV